MALAAFEAVAIFGKVAIKVDGGDGRVTKFNVNSVIIPRVPS